ncbi:hypothetical protein MCC10033_1538 [Bifidobacterium longum subsp. longum]|nr:hypothetical protein MCC10033_1538 [Bifidobacterium longum subsp. longum]
MLIPSTARAGIRWEASLSRRVNANSQQNGEYTATILKLIKKGEC